MAILLVLLLHFGVAAQFPARVGGAVALFADRLFYTGWSGVDLFFVLSGFLISSILLATKGDPPALYYRRFYARRALRIFPLYYAAIIATFFLLPLVVPSAAALSASTRQGQVWVWTYLVNVALVFRWRVPPDLLGHFWTLAIEEQYYLVWPTIVKKVTTRALWRISIALIVTAPLLRIALLAAGSAWDVAYRFTLTRIDAFGVGAVVALLATRDTPSVYERKYALRGLIAGVIGLVILIAALPRFYPSNPVVVTVGHSLLAITFGCLILVARQGHAALGWLRKPVLRSLGKYSYGVYVWHWPLFNLLQPRYALTPAAGWLDGAGQAVGFLVIGTVGSIGLGWVSYRLIEAPFLRLKRLFAYTASRQSRESRLLMTEGMISDRGIDV